MKIELVEEPRKDVFAEKSLTAVMRRAFFVVGSGIDLALSIVLAVALCVGVLIAAVWFDVLADAQTTASIIKDWAILGATFSTAVLGFLITGFSIFSTVTKPALFWELAQIKRDDRSVSEFKFIFFNFLYIFTHFLIYLTLSLGLAFLFVRASPVWYAAGQIPRQFAGATNTGAAIIAALYGSYTFYMLLILRGFIWNLYQSLLVAIFSERPPAV